MKQLTKIGSFAKNEFQEFIDKVENLVLFFDDRGNLLGLNDAARIRIIKNESQIEGKQLQDFLHDPGDIVKELLDPESLKNEGGSGRSVNLTLMGNDQTKIFCEGYPLKLSCDAKPVNCLVLTDMSKQRGAELADDFDTFCQKGSGRNFRIKVYEKLHGMINHRIDAEYFSLTLYKYQGRRKAPGVQRYHKFTKADDQIIDETLCKEVQESGKFQILYSKSVKDRIRARFQDRLPRIPELWIGYPIINRKKVSAVASVTYPEASPINEMQVLGSLESVAVAVGRFLEGQSSNEKYLDFQARIQALFDIPTHQAIFINRKLQITSFNGKFKSTCLKVAGVSPRIGSRFLNRSAGMPEFLNIKTFLRYCLRTFEGTEAHFPIQLVDREGKRRLFDVFTHPVRLGRTIAEILLLVREITSEYEMAKVARASRSKFNRIYESLQDVYFLTDYPRCKLTLVSPSVKDLLGSTNQELLGKSPADIFFDKDEFTRTSSKVKQLEKDMETGVKDFQFRLKTKGGTAVDVHCRMKFHRLGRGRWELEGTVRDITELLEKKRKVERQKEILARNNFELSISKTELERVIREKERFFANFSHEIRNPMNGIIHFIENLGNSTHLKNFGDDEIKKLIPMAMKSSKNLMNILENMLFISKSNSDEIVMNPEVINTSELLQSILSEIELSTFYNEDEMEIHIGGSDNLPEQMRVDATKVRQVCINLLTNAVKFKSSERKNVISLYVEKIRDRENHSILRAVVSDTGIGIKGKNLKSLFLEYHQIDNSRTKRYQGVGLGLPICNNLVRAMSGEMGVASEFGKGSEFSFTFEVETVKKKQIGKISSPTHDAGEEHKNLRVLVVDDDLLGREMTARNLQNFGCKLHKASSGEQVIALCKKTKLDLIFMDIQMPGLDGIETTRIVRNMKLNPKPFIVALSGYSLEGPNESYLDQGFDAYLVKPAARVNIKQTLDKFFGVQYKTEECKTHRYSNFPIVNTGRLHSLMRMSAPKELRGLLGEILTNMNRSIDVLLKNPARRRSLKNHLQSFELNASIFGMVRIKLQTQHLLRISQDRREKKGITQGLELLRDLAGEFRVAGIQAIEENESSNASRAQPQPQFVNT